MGSSVRGGAAGRFPTRRGRTEWVERLGIWYDRGGARVLGIGIVASCLVLLFLIRSWRVADLSWDSLAYHVPFAAMHAGLISDSNFVLPAHLSDAFDGFPSAIYYAKGMLWSLTGRAEAAQLIGVLSLIVFATFARYSLQTSWAWATVGVLAIPVIQTGMSTNMTDVPANIGMAMIALSTFRLLQAPGEVRARDLLWLIVACLIASGSKPQAVVVGVILYVAYLVAYVSMLRQLRSNLDQRYALILLAVAGMAASYPAIVNTVSFGNPIFPMMISIGPLQLPGSFSPGNWSDPAYLAHYPQPVRWLLSVLELHAYGLRHVPYTVDQGDVPHDSKSFRMGGYFAPLILMSLLAIAAVLSRQPLRVLVRSGLFLLFMTALVSLLPGSNELRYYSFWAITIVTAALMLLEANDHHAYLDGFSSCFRALVLVCLVFVMLITGGRYLSASGTSYAAAAQQYARERVVLFRDDRRYLCYGADTRGAIFDSRAFAAAAGDSVVIAKQGACPP